MSDLREELRLIGCHSNGDARCTCAIGQDAVDLIDSLRSEVEWAREAFRNSQARHAADVAEFVEERCARLRAEDERDAARAQLAIAIRAALDRASR